MAADRGLPRLRRRAGQAYGVVRQRLRPQPLSPVRFVIFGRGRSGSTTLVSLLDAVPDLRCEGEILSQATPFPRSYVRARCARSQSPVYGCKILSYQVEAVQPIRHREDFLRDLRDDGFKIVYLKRQNVVDHAVSNIRARQFGFHRQAAAGEMGGDVTVDPTELMSWLRRSDELDRFEAASLAGIDHLSLRYEHDLAYEELHRPTLLRVCAFLGLPTAHLPPVRSAYSKASPRALRDSVANYDELVALLAGTPYAQHLG